MTPTDVDQSILTRLFPTEIRRDLLLSSSLYLFVAICAAGFREYGDEPSFKHWANQAHQLGIHNAYKWGYDWLPLYLYVAKSVGWAYHCLGFASWFGDYSRALTFVLKVTMIALSAGFGVVVWHLASHANVNALRACRYCAYCPGLLLATGAFGYQDAFHTLIVTVAVLYAIRGSGPVALGFAWAACLTKPQATIYIIPVLFYFFAKGQWRQVVRSVPVAVILTGFIFAPFLYHQTSSDVFGMYLNVPRVHEWLSGCAHNVWWLWKPAPPFHSDRDVLVLGLRGIDLGLMAFVMCCALVLRRVLRTPEPEELILACGSLGLAFFMVVTEIHENHLFAAFPFLAICAARQQWSKYLFVGLSATFSIGLILTLWMLNTGHAWLPLGLRVDRFNAFLNVGLFIFAVFHLLRPGPSAPSQAGK